MTTPNLRRELDEIAMELEKKGHAKLAEVVDICNHEIHERKATVKPATVTKPKRAPKAAKTVSASVKKAAAAKLKDVRWARAELRDIAREYKKLGSIKEARQLLKMAEDLAEDEQELLEVTGPAMESTETVEGEDMDVDGDDLDMDTPVDDESAEGDDECVCVDVSYDDESPETYDDTIEGDDEEVTLDTVEACAKEIRAIARALRVEGDFKTAAVMQRLACECMDTGSELDLSAPVTVIPLPETDGSAPPIDATDFALGDDEDLIDFALEVAEENDDGEEVDLTNEFTPAEESEEPSDEAELETEEEVAPDESEKANEYMAAAKSLTRTAKSLRKAGAGDQANQLIRKAAVYKARAAKLSK